MSEIRTFRVIVRGDPPDTVRTLSGPLVGPSMGLVLREDNFVGRMEAEAARGGVTFWHKTSATEVTRDGGRYRVQNTYEGKPSGSVLCDWVLDAGGYDSRVSRRFGITRELEPESFHLGYELTTTDPGTLPDGQVAMWMGSWAPAGYIWSFPASKDGRPARRVGVGTPRSVKDPQGRTIGAKVFFDAWARECPGYVGEALAHEGGIIPTYRPGRSLHRGRVLSLGDAARLCDPVTGGGIAPAIGSGLAAARAVEMSDPGLYEQLVEPYRAEARLRWWFKQVFLGMGDEELRRFFDLFCAFPVPDDAGDPYALRRQVLRYLRRGGFKPLAVLWGSGRLWKALMG